jgi:hypothetical protein
MKADWNTVYREGCIALDARDVIGKLWVEAQPGSEAESILQRVDDYLSARFDIAMEFCDVVTGSVTADDPSSYECDIPF